MAPRIHDLAGVFRALGDATRLRLLALLAGGEVCVCHLHESLRLPQPTISRHLAYLRRAGLVETRRDGVWVHYRLARLEEPALRAALESAIHAAGHAPATRADQLQLDTRVPRDGGRTVLLPVVPCCGAGGPDAGSSEQ
jgi:ArsR family transcriptional regulator